MSSHWQINGFAYMALKLEAGRKNTFTIMQNQMTILGLLLSHCNYYNCWCGV